MAKKNDPVTIEDVAPAEQPEKNKVTLVKFIAAYRCYSPGDISGFNADISDRLISHKFAVAYEG